ncbi:MAG TPA: amidase [Candidatus Acidoferrales bacterium]|jgi:aspartyl-tRNA(Asn)/glutamyl-tRNA(Gln) amidotransferase subunit A|nr:amidase [Candidatus Acidoferrales bacterium]
MSTSASHDLALLDLTRASQAVQTKEVSPVDLTEACLARIEKLDSRLKAYITVTAESAMEEAHRAEKEIARGEWKGPLHGIPLAVKDLAETAGVRTTAASAVLQHYTPSEDAEVVRRLRQAGAVLLGKLNLHEFAYGGSGVISHFGAARNPWNAGHITGGSSSGSAAAVAAGLCYGAIGTDTAGSIRLPSAFCGIVGLKPSYGLVSTRGIIPLSWTLDHVGPMARTVSDTALILQAIAHYDTHDVYCQKFPPVYYPSALAEPVSALRLATPREFWQDADAEIVKAVDVAIGLLAQMTAGVHQISISTDSDRTVVRCEPWVYHQRYLPAHEKEYDPETLRRIRSGSDVPATGYIEKYRELLHQRREILHVFEEADLLLTPTCPVLPPSFAELEQQPAELRNRELLMLRNTRPWNAYGLPAISVPCGFSTSGLPIGLQIVGAPGSEGMVLSLARAFESQTEWHKRRPEI